MEGIMLTPATIVALAGFIVTMNGAIVVLAGWYKKIKSPEERQNEKIADIDKRLTRVETITTNAENEQKNIIKSMQMIQRSLFALISNAIDNDGSSKESLKKIQQELMDYIVDSN